MAIRSDRLTWSVGGYGDSSTVRSESSAAEELGRAKLSMDESRGMLRREAAEAQVSVTAGEVKGAIVHINHLFTISMVKSRLTQRLIRARKNIAWRRRQATIGEQYGPSLSDTEQDPLREVRDLTVTLTKDESALVNHDLANERERSLSDTDLQSAVRKGCSM